MECTLYLTDYCNLKCSYCYQGDSKKNNFLDESTLEQALEYMININPEGEKIHLNLFGGEPLLNKNLVYKVIDFTKDRYKNLFNYSMTTNCTLIDDNIIQLFKENNFNIRVSIDGDEYTHNLNRKSIDNKNNYEKILANILRLKDEGIEASIRMTITPNNVNQLYKNILFFYDLGFKKYCVGLNYLDNWNAEELQELDNQLLKLKEFYTEKMKKNEDIFIDIFDGKITSIIGGRKPLFCCAGTKKHIVIGTSGDIYPCTLVAYDEKWNIGNIKTGINSSALKTGIKQSVCENKFCEACSINFTCHGRKCGFLNYKSTQFLNKSSDSICKIEQIVYKYNKFIIKELYNNKNAIRMNQMLESLGKNGIEIGKEFINIISENEND